MKHSEAIGTSVSEITTGFYSIHYRISWEAWEFVIEWVVPRESAVDSSGHYAFREDLEPRPIGMYDNSYEMFWCTELRNVKRLSVLSKFFVSM